MNLKLVSPVHRQTESNGSSKSGHQSRTNAPNECKSNKQEVWEWSPAKLYETAIFRYARGMLRPVNVAEVRNGGSLLRVLSLERRHLCPFGRPPVRQSAAKQKARTPTSGCMPNVHKVLLGTRTSRTDKALCESR